MRSSCTLASLNQNTMENQREMRVSVSTSVSDEATWEQTVLLPSSSGEVTTNTSRAYYSTPYHDDGSDFLRRVDLLTVFQADPLAYKSKADRRFWPIPTLDFDLERETLVKAVNEAYQAVLHSKVDLAFEICTVDRLGAFLAAGESEILHFSGHGHSDYLFIENGWGAGQPLSVKKLKEWIRAGGCRLKFVFVSACYSRVAGEEFVKAGVPHVVCCQQEMGSIAAVEFARAFYRALASGSSLDRAFELGKHAVRLSPHVDDSDAEMNKFVLLPEGGNHDVPIFFNKPPPYKFARKGSTCRPSRSRRFPVPPQYFVGRRVDILGLIHQVQHCRIVRVTGERGIGKCSMVTSAVHYMDKRKLMEDIFWLPAPYKWNGYSNDIVAWLSRVFDDLQNDQGLNETCGKAIFEELHEKKTLIVMDARTFSEEGIGRLAPFLEDLMKRTKHTRVIVFHRGGNQMTNGQFSCRETDIKLGPLSFESAVSLFLSLCGRIEEYRQELKKLLIDRYEKNPTEMQHRSKEVFKILGNGNPEKASSIAKKISAEDCQNLIDLAKRPLPLSFKTRGALEKRVTLMNEEIEEKIRANDFRSAKVIQDSLNEIEVLRETLLDLDTLKRTADETQEDLNHAILVKDFGAAAELHSEWESLLSKIELEERELVRGQSGESQRSKTGTRTFLEAEERKLEAVLDDAIDHKAWRRAHIINEKLVQVKNQKEKVLSTKQLSATLDQLKVDLEKATNEAKQEHKWEKPRNIHHRIVDLEQRLQLESEAENELQGRTTDSGAKLPPTPTVPHTISRNHSKKHAGSGKPSSVSSRVPGSCRVDGEIISCSSASTSASDSEIQDINDGGVASRIPNERGAVNEHGKHPSNVSQGPFMDEQSQDEEQLPNNLTDENQVVPVSSAYSTAPAGLVSEQTQNSSLVGSRTDTEDLVERDECQDFDNVAAPSVEARSTVRPGVYRSFWSQRTSRSNDEGSVGQTSPRAAMIPGAYRVQMPPGVSRNNVGASVDGVSHEEEPLVGESSLSFSTTAPTAPEEASEAELPIAAEVAPRSQDIEARIAALEARDNAAAPTDIPTAVLLPTTEDDGLEARVSALESLNSALNSARTRRQRPLRKLIKRLFGRFKRRRVK